MHGKLASGDDRSLVVFIRSFGRVLAIRCMTRLPSLIDQPNLSVHLIDTLSKRYDLIDQLELVKERAYVITGVNRPLQLNDSIRLVIKSARSKFKPWSS